MDRTDREASMSAHAAAFDSLARSLQVQLPRRRMAAILAAALATGMFGLSTHTENAEARRKRGKRGTRRVNRRGVEVARGASIPPNCIYVCCDGTCDVWTMCMKCVKWPKPTTVATLASE